MWGSSLLATHLSYRRAVPGALVTLSQPPSPVVIVAGGTQLYAIIGAPRSGLAGDRAALQVDVGWARRPVGMPPSMWDASFGPEAQVMLWLP